MQTSKAVYSFFESNGYRGVRTSDNGYVFTKLTAGGNVINFILNHDLSTCNVCMNILLSNNPDDAAQDTSATFQISDVLVPTITADIKHFEAMCAAVETVVAIMVSKNSEIP